MKAYFDEQSPMCPVCSGYMRFTEGRVANDERAFVACLNPKCPELGKRKSYPRPFVELRDE